MKPLRFETVTAPASRCLQSPRRSRDPSNAWTQELTLHGSPWSRTPDPLIGQGFRVRESVAVDTRNLRDEPCSVARALADPRTRSGREQSMDSIYHCPRSQAERGLGPKILRDFAVGSMPSFAVGWNEGFARCLGCLQGVNHFLRSFLFASFRVLSFQTYLFARR